MQATRTDTMHGNVQAIHLPGWHPCMAMHVDGPSIGFAGASSTTTRLANIFVGVVSAQPRRSRDDLSYFWRVRNVPHENRVVDAKNRKWLRKRRNCRSSAMFLS